MAGRQIRRGTNAERVALGGASLAEFIFETDTKDLYIGAAGGDQLISDASAWAHLVGQDQPLKKASAPQFASLLIGIDDYPTDEFDGGRIYTPVITEYVGRGLKIESFYAGTYASSGIDVTATAQGANDQNHISGGQITTLVDVSGKTITSAYGIKVAGSVMAGTVTDFYMCYLHSVTGYGTATRKWSLFSASENPSYIKAQLGIGLSAAGAAFAADLNYGIDIRTPFSTGAYGFYKGQIICYSNTAHAINVGGVLALGGESGLSTTPYPFAHIGGLKRIAGTYEGYLVFHTSSGGAGGEANGGNYERMRVLYEGLSLATGRVYMVNMVQVLGPRVIDARADDTINTGAWDATTAGVLEALRTAAITHGWLAAA